MKNSKKHNNQVVRTTSSHDEKTYPNHQRIQALQDIQAFEKVIYTQSVKEMVCRDLVEEIEKKIKNNYTDELTRGLEISIDVIEDYAKN